MSSCKPGCRAWYHHPLYDRYWKHYQMMHEWFQNCKNYELVGRERPGRGVGVPLSEPVISQRIPKRHSKREFEDSRRPKFHKSRPVNVTYDQPTCKVEEENGEEGSDELEFIISDEYLEFMKESEAFRKERDAARKRELGADDIEYIDISTLTVEGLPKWGLADMQAKAAEKSKKTKEWYGNEAPIVNGYEACMIAAFQNYRVKHNPSMWPSMPLNIKFD